MSEVRVADVMTHDVAVIHQGADVHELEKLLLARRVHGVPVVDGDGTLVGVVSQTDLVNWHYDAGVDGASFYDAAGRLPAMEGTALSVTDIRSARVDEVMSPVVHCIRSDRPLALAAATMIRHRIHRLIVVDGAMRVQGVVSALDALRTVPGVEQLVGPSARVRKAVAASRDEP